LRFATSLVYWNYWQLNTRGLLREDPYCLNGACSVLLGNLCNTLDARLQFLGGNSEFLGSLSKILVSMSELLDGLFELLFSLLQVARDGLVRLFELSHTVGACSECRVPHASIVSARCGQSA
jgi:hypothetical protein